jgi:hypothetical protein
MATFPSDFLQLNLDICSIQVSCDKAGLEWPPPERLYLTKEGKIKEATPEIDEDLILVRVRYSQLSDEVAKHPNIARGAEYRYLKG